MALDPGRNCPLCARLVDFRLKQRAAHPDWHNAPVPAFGTLDSRLLIVGLAPGLQGANRTGRPFTGDWAGDLLYATLLKFHFARGHYDERADDGLTLVDCRISNAARCVPPENKPLPVELNACNQFLKAEIAAMRRLKAIMILGLVSHGAVLNALGQRKSSVKFAHGAIHKLPNGITLHNSYHCSRYNTNTGRLTTAMFEHVVADLRNELDK